MTEDGFFRAQIDGDESWRLIRFLFAGLFELVIHSAPIWRSHSVIPTSATSPGRARIAQNRKQLLRACPTFYVDFFIGNPACRLEQAFVFSSASAEFALTMRRNLCPNRGCPQVCDMAKKRYWTLAVSIFHFAVRWTHSAE